MSVLEVRNLKKSFGKDTVVLKGVDFSLEKGETVAIIGSSGSGKTTLLRCLNFLTVPDEGQIVVNDETLFDDADPNTQKEREIRRKRLHFGLVFQNFNLFPQYTARQNVMLASELLAKEQPDYKAQKKLLHAQIAARAEELLTQVGLKEKMDLYPHQLSGGQQQRVALARAIVIKPDVLLMDEPLSNLDAKLRIEMRNAIRQIQNSVGITTIYVTHDQEEAMAVSDRIAVMSGGVIQHVSTPKSIYQRPANQFVANFIGRSNTLKARYAQGALHFDNGYAMPYDNCGSVPAEDVLVAVRPEEFVLAADGQQGIDATVTSSVFLGLNTTYFVELYDGTNAEIVEESSISSIIPNGTKVKLTLKQDKINVFTADGKTNLTKGVVNDVR